MVILPVAVGDRVSERGADTGLESGSIAAPVPRKRGPASVVGIRLASNTEFRAGKLIVGAIAASVLVFVTVVLVARNAQYRPRVRFVEHDQNYLDLTREDDYYSVLRKLGQPDTDHWKSGELQYR